MKLYTEQQVKKLLDAQKGNCYVAVSNAVRENVGESGGTIVETIASAAAYAPQPAGDQFDKMYGIDPEQLLIEDLADNELSLRYERFKKDLAYANEKYNELVPIINERIKLIDTLKESIVGLASQNVSTSNVVTDLKTIVDELNQYKEAADSLMSQINENKKLIKDYEDWSERKLFMHWKYLTHFKVVKEDWITWKAQHKDVMI